MLAKEVEYRLAKWVLLNMEADGIISEEELKVAWHEIAQRLNPPFRDIEDYDSRIGDGVIVDAR